MELLDLALCVANSLEDGMSSPNLALGHRERIIGLIIGIQLVKSY